MLNAWNLILLAVKHLIMTYDNAIERNYAESVPVSTLQNVDTRMREMSVGIARGEWYHKRGTKHNPEE